MRELKRQLLGRAAEGYWLSLVKKEVWLMLSYTTTVTVWHKFELVSAGEALLRMRNSMFNESRVLDVLMPTSLYYADIMYANALLKWGVHDAY